MEDLLTMIGNIGFPIAVSVYLLVRVENKLDQLTLAIRDLEEAINSFKLIYNNTDSHIKTPLRANQ